MGLKLVTPPAVEPVELDEAKLFLRQDGALDDAMIEEDVIADLISSARQMAEDAMNRALITQTWRMTLDAFPRARVIELPNPPLQSVTSIEYATEDGETRTFDATNYIVDPDKEPGRIALKKGRNWPTETLQSIAGVRITFVAGYGDAATDVPAAIRQGILKQVAKMYEHRTDGVAQETAVGVGSIAWQAQDEAKALWRPYRIMPGI